MPVVAKNRQQTLSLPTAVVSPDEFLWDHNIALWGRKSIGKSTVTGALQWMLDQHYGDGEKKVLNFRFEAGRRNLPILQVPNEKGLRLTWPTFKEYHEMFCDDDSFKTGVIDSIDKCYDSCFDWVCEEHNVTHPKEAGKDAPGVWDAIKIEFSSLFYAGMDCGKNYVFLSHQKERVEDNVDGTEFRRFDLTCKPAAAGAIKEICEFVIHYGYTDVGVDKKDKKSDRVMTIRNRDNSLEVGCGRDDKFLDPEGRPLFRFHIPTVYSQKESIKTAEVVGNAMLAAYDNRLYDYDYDPEAEAASAKALESLAKKKSVKKAPVTIPSIKKKVVPAKRK